MLRAAGFRRTIFRSRKMRMARLGAAGGGDVMSERSCSPASIRVRCALRSREGADAGEDDAGAKGPPRPGGK